MTILDRYVLKKFLVPFLYCLIGFIAIWFVFDLSDNLQDFMLGNASFQSLWDYYASQIPEIVVMSVPIGTLLAILYSFSAMSRSNEIITMLGAGRSIVRILLPLMVVGVFLTGLTTYFNYESAPHASGIKKVLVGDIRRGAKAEKSIRAHLFRNREDRRTWFVSRMPLSGARLTGVQIVQQDPEGSIVQQWYAREATYDSNLLQWNLTDARYVEMNTEGDILKAELKDMIRIDGWSETPWRIASSMLNADFLSVEELNDYLKYNSDFPASRLAPYLTHWHYRWAMPTICFLVIFVAAPCAIVYSRRGVLGGVATAIGMFFSLVFVSLVFIALGKGNRVSPAVAAWGPMFAFFLIGLFMLWMKSTNRDMPKLKIPRIQ